MKKEVKNQILNDFRLKKSLYWEKEGKRTALRVYKKTIQDIPAYKAFIKEKRGNVSAHLTPANFLNAPLTSKKTYLVTNPLKDLSKTSIRGPITYSSTSGSTGKAFYFPRNSSLDWEYSFVLESFLQNLSNKKPKERTLIIIGFGMGVWIGGLITYRAFQFVGERLKSLSIITPGINKKEIFNALRDLSPYYDRTVLVGYPPFIKDIVDESKEEGIQIKKLNINFLFAAEAFSESFRDYLAKSVNIANIHTDTLNIYGTADIGAMAFETPTSILIRRLVLSNPKTAEAVFGKINRTPTLAQYNPSFVHFEELRGEIVLTGDSEVPLVRYKVGDHGGVYSFTELDTVLKKQGIDLYKEAKKLKVPIYELPFVFVYERTDFSTTLYGLQIYPETVREVLIKKPFQSVLSGKFTLSTVFDKNKNQRLEIHIEQKKGRTISTEKRKLLLKMLVDIMRKHNSEFRELSDFLGKRSEPKIYFLEAGNPKYFPVGVKQKWVKK